MPLERRHFFELFTDDDNGEMGSAASGGRIMISVRVAVIGHF